MNCNAHRYQDEKSSERPMLRNPDCAIKQGKPESRDRNDLDMKRYRLVYHEIGYVAAQTRMIEQPVIQFSVAAKEQGRRKQKQRCGGKYGQKYPQDS